MTQNYDPAPGTIGLAPIAGKTGLFIRVGQWLITKIDRVRLREAHEGWADWQHAFVFLGNGKIIEAEPGGARIADVSEYPHVYWCENIAAKYAGKLPEVARYAPTLAGTPYSFIDYLAIALRALHVPVPFLQRYIASSRHMICSALCAFAYEEAGASLYPYWTGYVNPLDIYVLDRSLGRKP